MAKYLLIKIWLPGNRIEVHIYIHVDVSIHACTCHVDVQWFTLVCLYITMYLCFVCTLYLFDLCDPTQVSIVLAKQPGRTLGFSIAGGRGSTPAYEDVDEVSTPVCVHIRIILV